MKKITLIVIALSTSLCCVMSCKKKNEEPAPATPTGSTALTINSAYQAKYALDGTNYADINGTDFEMANGADNSINSIGAGPSTFKYSSGIWKESTGKGIDIKKGTITLPNGGAPPSDAEFLALFSTGASSYSINGANGIVITFWDGTTNWGSDLGTGVQTGSLFNILDRQAVTSTDYTVKVFATFNCKLYDGLGNVKTLTNGSFIGAFAKI